MAGCAKEEEGPKEELLGRESNRHRLYSNSEGAFKNGMDPTESQGFRH